MSQEVDDWYIRDIRRRPWYATLLRVRLEGEYQSFLREPTTITAREAGKVLLISEVLEDTVDYELAADPKRTERMGNIITHLTVGVTYEQQQRQFRAKQRARIRTALIELRSAIRDWIKYRNFRAAQWHK